MQDQTQTTEQPSSLLSTDQAAPAAAEDWRTGVADKFKTGDEINVEALWKSYQHAEKRIGSGDIPPKTAAEYAANFPDGFDAEPFADLVTGMREKAHAAGMTQAQFDAVIGEIMPALPDTIQAMVAEGLPNPAKAEATLRETWQDEKAYQNNMLLAQKAYKYYADADMSIDDIGNNPTMIRLLAKLGSGLAEDVPVNHAAIMPTESVRSMMASEAYINPRHPDHASTHARVKAHYSNLARRG